jgi:hypothetical protein
MKAALLEHAVHSLKPGVFEELMELMGSTYSEAIAPVSRRT